MASPILVTAELAIGEGIEAAVAGTEIVLHLAGGAEGDEAKAARLVRAASQAEVVQLTYRPAAPNWLRCEAEPPAWKECASVIIGTRSHHTLDPAAASYRH